MQQHIHTIVKHFFQKDSLQEVPEQVLQQFTAEHPYAAVGHWLLAKKVHDCAPDRSETQAAGAVAWFSNPLWLHWTLQEHEPVAETLLIPTPKEETVARVAPRPVVSEPAPPEPEPIIPAIETKAPETPAAIPPVEAPAATPVEESLAEPEETEILIPGVSEPVSLVEVAPPPPPVEESIEEPEEKEETTTGEPVAVAPAEEEPVAQIPAPAEESIKEPAAEEEPAPAEEPKELAIKPIIPPSLASELRESFKPVISEAEEPIFEPYHTIDYFASQGIKLRQEDLKDKLGMQLKSFTDWLRSMKRIAPAMQDPIPEAIDEKLQRSIQTSAGHSVEGKEIVTEAMAEVWVKQGSKQKAIAIYEKLSLLNPAKSPYFAARIDQIKAM